MPAQQVLERPWVRVRERVVEHLDCQRDVASPGILHVDTHRAPVNTRRLSPRHHHGDPDGLGVAGRHVEGEVLQERIRPPPEVVEFSRHRQFRGQRGDVDIADRANGKGLPWDGAGRSAEFPEPDGDLLQPVAKRKQDELNRLVFAPDRGDPALRLRLQVHRAIPQENVTSRVRPTRDHVVRVSLARRGDEPAKSPEPAPGEQRGSQIAANPYVLCHRVGPVRRVRGHGRQHLLAIDRRRQRLSESLFRVAGKGGIPIRRLLHDLGQGSAQGPQRFHPGRVIEIVADFEIVEPYLAGPAHLEEQLERFRPGRDPPADGDRGPLRRARGQRPLLPEFVDPGAVCMLEPDGQTRFPGPGRLHPGRRGVFEAGLRAPGDDIYGCRRSLAADMKRGIAAVFHAGVPAEDRLRPRRRPGIDTGRSCGIGFRRDLRARVGKPDGRGVNSRRDQPQAKEGKRMFPARHRTRFTRNTISR